MLKTRIAVIRGGPSTEYEISLISGLEALTALRTFDYFVRDIIVSKTGEWLVEGLHRQPETALADIDVVFIAMHGQYGEDGTIQRICERLNIPFTGSNSLPSKLAFNKDSTKRALQNTNIKLPKHIRVNSTDVHHVGEIVSAVKRSFGKKFVLKPLAGGSSLGVVMVDSIDELPDTLKSVLGSTEEEFLLEERIMGIEATCGVLEGFREEAMYVLPAIEIIPPTHCSFFSADVKYTGETEEICPGRFSYSVKEKIAEATRLAHLTLGLTQYSRSDFIVQGDDVYFLEVNTLPGLTPQSLFPKSAEAVGLPFRDLVRYLVETARVY